MLKKTFDVRRIIAFQSDGQPRAWLRFLLLKDQRTGKPRKHLDRIIFKKNGCVRLIYADWYEQYLRSENHAKFAPYLSFIRGQIASGRLARAQKMHIVTTPHTQVIATMLADCLSEARFEITSSLSMPTEFIHDLYIVVAPQMFDTLPPPGRTIMMQMEQVNASNWVNSKYLERLNQSIAIIDYSTSNIDALVKKGIPSRQIFYVPLIPYKTLSSRTVDRDIDVLFYGALSSPRREKYIKAISNKFKIRVESNIFGSELHQVLLRTKVVANIHFYDDALLETTRILEAVSFGAKVVSETAKDQASYSLLDPVVTFAQSDDIDAFSDALAETLKSVDTSFSVPDMNDLRATKYHVLRAFNAVGILSNDELFSLLENCSLPSDRIVLALPEHQDRYKFAQENLLPGASFFHGLRNVDGWKGCAASYKLLAVLALREARSSLLVYEDDAQLPTDVVNRLQTIEHYLAENAESWDVFSGLISDIGTDISIFRIDDLKGEKFVYSDAFVGLVFCIYGQKVLEIMSRFEFIGEDIKKHTIDRFLEAKKPRSLTTLPPLVGHAEQFSSSIWNNKNVHSLGMISNSTERLEHAAKSYSKLNGA